MGRLAAHPWPHRPLLASLGLLLLVASAGCSGHARTSERCLDCHSGLEVASRSHTGCVSCHGGNPAVTEKRAAHRAMYDLADPSSSVPWERACGPCHRQQVDRVRSSQMFTNAGMIAQIQSTWEGEQPGVTYGTRAETLHASDGKGLDHASVSRLENLAGELYRKSCARCHVARPNDIDDPSGHRSGCAACHMPNGGAQTSPGNNQAGRLHALRGLPPMDACARCHHRSGRIALSYQGLMDGNNGLVPTRGGLPGPVPGSDDRSFTHIAADVHFDAGMECIDCHTSREVMGDGYAAADMHGQLEIRCEDCHGDGVRSPRFVTASRELDPPIAESRLYGSPIRPGAKLVVTSKGRPYSNVFEKDGKVVLATKRSGKLLPIKVITGTPEHRIAGHGRMGCSSCHSRTVAQCYGCHTAYDKRQEDLDVVRNAVTPGAFRETEDYRTLYPFPLALDARGTISPVTPGCQTFVTVIEPDGRASVTEEVARYKQKRQFRFAAFEGHNTGSRAVGCTECHANPSFLGFGQHVLERGDVRSTLLCERNPKKALDGFLGMDEGRIVSHAAITRSGARPLRDEEVRRVFAVNLCLVCHESGRDPIYRSLLNYDALDDTLHRRLLDPGR